MKLFMVVEHFPDGKAHEVYTRFQQRGRMAPRGVEYVDSWVDADITRCWQLMRAESLEKLHEWARNWEDIVRFEIIPVISGGEAAARVMGGGR